MQINSSSPGAGYAKLYGKPQAFKTENSPLKLQTSQNKIDPIVLKFLDWSDYNVQTTKPIIPDPPPPAPIRLARPVSAIPTEDFLFLKQNLNDNPKLKLVPKIKDAALFLREGQDTSIYHTADGDTLLNARPDAEDPQSRHKNWNFQKKLSSLIDTFSVKWVKNQKTILENKNRKVFSGELSREIGLSGKHIRVVQEIYYDGKRKDVFFLFPRNEKYNDMKSFILKAPPEAKHEYINAMKALTKKYPPQLPGSGDKDYCFRTASGELNFFPAFATEYRPKNGFPYTKSVDNDCHIRRFKRDEDDYFLYQHFEPIGWKDSFNPTFRTHEALVGYYDK